MICERIVKERVTPRKAVIVARLRVAVGLLTVSGLGGLIVTSTPDRPLKAAQGAAVAEVVRGTVVDARTGMPLRSASVQVSSIDGAFQRGAVSREDGQFEVPDVPEGRYRVAATKAGYLGARLDQTHFADPEGFLDLGQERNRGALLLRMWPSAAIAGIVRDSIGEPLANVQIQVLRLTYFDSEQRILPSPLGARTDSRGAFRIGGLVPGSYYVAARPRHQARTASSNVGEMPSYGPTYYPQATKLSDATPLTLQGGETTTLDLWMMPVSPAALSGIAVDSGGEPLRGRIVTVREFVGGHLVPVTHTFVSASGAFRVEGLWPGTYVLGASVEGVEDSEATTLPLVVDGDVSGIAVATEPAQTFSGRLLVSSFSGGSLLPTTLGVSVVPIYGGHMVTANVLEDWSFLGRAQPGVVRIRVENLPPDAAVESIIIDGRRARNGVAQLEGRDHRIEISVVASRAEISGSVKRTHTDEFGHGSVVVFAVNRSIREAPFVRSIALGPDGTYTVRSLPAGDYYVAAVAGVSPDFVTQPDLLERLESRAHSVRVGTSDKRSVNFEATVP